MGLQRGLELAEIREHKFLKSGNRELMSPLQVRSDSIIDVSLSDDLVIFLLLSMCLFSRR